MRQLTELELHCINACRGNEGVWGDLDFEIIDHKNGLKTNSEHHILIEFSDGYSSGYYHSNNDEKKLIDQFVEIVRRDEYGEYEYNYRDFKEVIEKCIKKFGL